MVCALLRRFWFGLRKWFQESPLRKLGSATSSTDRLQASGDVKFILAKQKVQKLFNIWKTIQKPYDSSNYGFTTASTTGNQLFEPDTVVIYSDGSHFPLMTISEWNLFNEIKENKSLGKGDRERRLKPLIQKSRREKRTAIGIYMGTSHPLELGIEIGKHDNSFKGECVAIAVGLHRPCCWPKYDGEKVVLRTDCLWAITVLKSWAENKAPDLEKTDGTKYNLVAEDTDNLNYVRYVAMHFPKGVVFQYVKSHTKQPDPGLSMADKLATEANKSQREQGQEHNDKEVMIWNPKMHEHFIQAHQNASKNREHAKNYNAMQKHNKLLENYGKVTEITKFLKEKEDELIKALDIDYS